MATSILARAGATLGFSAATDTNEPRKLRLQWLRLLLLCFALLALACCVPLMLRQRTLQWAAVLVMMGFILLLRVRCEALLERPLFRRAAMFLGLVCPTATQWAFGGCSSSQLVVSLSLMVPLLATLTVEGVEERRFWQAMHSAMMTLGALMELTLMGADAAIGIVVTYSALLVLGWVLTLGVEQIHRQTIAALARASELAEELHETQTSLGEAGKVKNDFLASMSHEIRTPMHAISGMADMLLLSNQLNATEFMQVENIKLASQSLLGLITDILDISKMEANKLELYEERYDFPSMFHDVVSIISMRARDSGLIFLTQVDPDVPKEMVGDSGRIRQVLLNLLGNAVKFTERGSVTLTVQRVYEENQLMLRFEVTDTGVGIRTEDIGRLFGLFEQLETTRAHNRQGTGLGLAISRRLVELMRGKLEMHSELGRGTTFHFTIAQKVVSDIPIAMVPNAREKRLLVCSDSREFYENAIEMASRLKVKAVRGLPSNANGYTHMLLDLTSDSAYAWIRQPTPPGCQRALLIDPATTLTVYIRMSDRVLFHPLHIMTLSAVLNDTLTAKSATQTATRDCLFQTQNARVLLIDDNEISLMVAANLLKLYGVQVDQAISGEQGIAMMENIDYDIVFIDHIMPGMDGVDTVRAIRAKGGRFTNQVLLMLSANVMPESKKLFLQSGCQDMLAKPIELPKLSQLLREYLPPDHIAASQNVNSTAGGFLQSRIKRIEDALQPLRLTRAQHLSESETIDVVDAYLVELQTTLLHLMPIFRLLNDCALKVSRYHTLVPALQAARSLLSRIGETRLSALAKVLAFSLEEKDFIYVQENLSDYVLSLDAFLQGLNTALQDCEVAMLMPPRENMLLETLHEQLLGFQFDDAQETIASLRDACARVASEQVTALYEYLQGFDYASAHELVLSLLELVGQEAS